MGKDKRLFVCLLFPRGRPLPLPFPYAHTASSSVFAFKKGGKEARAAPSFSLSERILSRSREQKKIYKGKFIKENQ